MIKRVFILLALVLALFSAQACGQGSSNSEKFRAIDHRDLISLISESKAKVTVVNFWATWCPSCREELGVLAKLRQAFSEKELDIIGVSVDRTASAVQSFFGATPPPYPIYMGGEEVSQAFLVRTIPKLLIYKDGRPALNHVGYLGFEELSAIVRKAASE